MHLRGTFLGGEGLKLLLIITNLRLFCIGRTNFFTILVGGPLLETRFLGRTLLEKSAFLASKLRDGPLLEHGPLIEFLW